ncbi:hypothetical protein CLOM_g12689 [Closterium sp. NIES-68]|nr:hypothetical protein CLOM_g12689 [Closterium sp. NIES-68]
MGRPTDTSPSPSPSPAPSLASPPSTAPHRSASPSAPDHRDTDAGSGPMDGPEAAFASLIAEAGSQTAGGRGGEGGGEAESDEERARRALDCPCLDKLREGVCWEQFAESFRCYYVSKEEDQGSDCVSQFSALQSCISANASHFQQYLVEEGEADLLNAPVERDGK